MRAAWYEKQGPAREVLIVGDMPDPVPAPGEIRIRVAASGISLGDIKKRQDAFGYGMPYPRVIPHNDGAGHVDRVGEGVSSQWMGRQVWCYGAQSYRPFGTAAEYTVVPVDQVSPLPETAPIEQGACLGIPGITAGLIEDELPPVDFWVMAMSLPGAHGVTLDTIPPPITPVHWRPIRRRRLRVGLCWQGGMRLWDPEAVNYDGRRSISLDIFARVLVPGVTYYSLSKDSRLEDRARFDEFRILDVGESFGDFLDTMEFMANELDLVISVDTAIAHAAGTVGVPVWVLCARPHDWSWLQGRDDSPAGA